MNDLITLKVSITHPRSENEGIIQAREMLVVNEPGLYRLIFQSRKPEAEAFKTWVFTEVLPAIRKNGYFATPEIMTRLERIEDAIKAARLLSPREVQMRELENYLFDKIVLTGDKRDHVEFFRLFYDHESHLTRPIPKDAFASAVVYLFPQIRVCKRYGGTEFIGCRLKGCA